MTIVQKKIPTPLIKFVKHCSKVAINAHHQYEYLQSATRISGETSVEEIRRLFEQRTENQSEEKSYLAPLSPVSVKQRVSFYQRRVRKVR